MKKLVVIACVGLLLVIKSVAVCIGVALGPGEREAQWGLAGCAPGLLHIQSISCRLTA